VNQELDSLLLAANFAQLGTVNSDGTPHIDTVWYEYKEEMLVVATTMATRKAKNLSANPAGYIVVTNKDNGYEQAQMKVELACIEPDGDMKVCDSIALRYTGRKFPQRGHKNRVAIYLRILSCKYHVARV